MTFLTPATLTLDKTDPVLIEDSLQMLYRQMKYVATAVKRSQDNAPDNQSDIKFDLNDPKDLDLGPTRPKGQ